MGIGIGLGDDECYCDHSYYIRQYEDMKKKYEDLEKLVNELLDAQPKSHKFYKSVESVDKLYVRRLMKK